MFMEHTNATTIKNPVYSLAAVFVIALAFIPDTAMSGAYTTDRMENTRPRWSNDRHHEDGLIVGRDCVALPPGAGAQYVPGRDAWGRTILPAEPPRGFYNSFPVEVELDILLKHKNIGGKNIDVTANATPYIEQAWQLRDCHPSQK